MLLPFSSDCDSVRFKKRCLKLGIINLFMFIISIRFKNHSLNLVKYMGTEFTGLSINCSVLLKNIYEFVCYVFC